jgi:hypothetical protein
MRHRIERYEGIRGHCNNLHPIMHQPISAIDLDAGLGGGFRDAMGRTGETVR